MKRCLLCCQNTDHLAKAHIFAVGFFAKQMTKAHVNSVSPSDGKGRRLPNALYDHEIICDECEHRIMQPLDDNAIKVFRDKMGGYRIPLPAEAPMGMLVFEDVDRRKIRAFLGSVLWRLSVSKQPEVRNISIGNIFKERIQEDLLHDGDFSYVDMLLMYLAHPVHGAFALPNRIRLAPIDKDRDWQRINGWKLALPNIMIQVSLDKRPHPSRMFLKLAPDLTGRDNPLYASTSLAQDDDKYCLLAFESVRDDGAIKQILKALDKWT